MKVTLVRAWPRRHEMLDLDLPPGTTVLQAVMAAGWSDASWAVHGIRAGADQVLRDGDRIECLRPLEMDPKQARRQRAAGQPLR